MMKKRILTIAVSALCAMGISGCDDERRTVIPPVVTGDLLLLTADNELASINLDKPGELELVSKEKIKGLNDGDSLVGIDYRPKDGQLYAIGYLGNIYTINTANTTAEFVKKLKANSADTTVPFTGITGDKTQIAVNFDPLTDRLRLVGSNGQNLRINVDNGATVTDGTINGADATVTSIAHTNSFPETKSTRLFGIDVKQDRLFLQSPANDGTLGTSAALDVDATGSSGFAINGINNQGFAVLTVNGTQQLYSIDLSSIGTETKAAKLKGKLPTLANVHSIALKDNIYTTSYGVGLTNNNSLSNSNKLVVLNLTNPEDVRLVNISGLLANDESIVGIDYRQSIIASGASGLLYGLSNKGNLYTINPNTGVATKKVALIAATDDTTQPFSALSGSHFAVDFDPVADNKLPITSSLRVISNTGQNLSINVNTGATTTDAELNGIPSAQVSAAAHTNSFGTATATQLFNLERSTNKLTLQALPSNGTLTAVGPLGITLGNATGFDISGGDNGLALAVVNAGEANTSTLYKINLTTGKAAYAISKKDVSDAVASKIGSDKTPIPALIDIALIQAQ